MKREILSEFLSTYLLVFVGCSAIVCNSLYGNLGAIGISLVFGLTVTILIIAFGKISGAHMNPSVTIALAISKNFEKKKVIPYITAQIFGAVAASLTTFMIFYEPKKPLEKLAYLGATLPSGSPFQSFTIEIILTFILMIVIYLSAVDKKAQRHLAPFAIGFAVGVDALFGGAISGASINPARSIGPAIVAGKFNYLWLYILAPTIGALIAAKVYESLKTTNID